jgi:GntR family transcriptional regulator, transcriptional repressor for pyruvate dehydrogenase complex
VILETGVLPHVSRRMKDDPAIEARLRELVEQFRSARDLKSWIELDIRFHRSLLDASGLQPLVAFGDLLHVFFQRFRESVKKAEWQSGVESHQRIVDELAKGHVEAATAELRKHIESHKERLP